jgi:antitoxin PrlF
MNLPTDIVRPLVSRITTKGQVTIPVELRRLLGVGPHDLVAFEVSDGAVRLVPASAPPPEQGVIARTAGMLRSTIPALPPDLEKLEREEAMAAEADSAGGRR